jgi:mycothiol maleylpyruvate isomerase-like protein
MSTATMRSREAEAFLDALQDTAPSVVTACDGWTAHEITAHLAAAAAEITRHLEPYLRGDPVPQTQSFEVREAPFQALDDPALRRRLEAEEEKMRAVIDQVLECEPDAVIPWTGRQMVVAKFVPHMRNEFTVHRWDFAGDGETGPALLAQPDLTEHAVTVLGRLLVAAGARKDPAPGEDFAVRLRSPGARDVRVAVENGQAGLQLADDDADEPYAEADAAARTLVIWGRRPDQRGRFRSHLAAPMLARLQALLSGY